MAAQKGQSISDQNFQKCIEYIPNFFKRCIDFGRTCTPPDTWTKYYIEQTNDILITDEDADKDNTELEEVDLDGYDSDDDEQVYTPEQRYITKVIRYILMKHMYDFTMKEHDERYGECNVCGCGSKREYTILIRIYDHDMEYTLVDYRGCMTYDPQLYIEDI